MFAVEMRNITMAFGNFKANDNITMKVKKNSVHAIIGENGAGKSTLMSVLFGLYNQTDGEIWINGQLVTIDSPIKANFYGIGMVHQHFKLVEDFTVLQNIVLTSEETVAKTFVTYKNTRKQIKELMEKYGFEVDLDKKISNCSVAEQQRVEILKMLYRNSEILIFDEPTAVLSPKQIDSFLDALLELKAKGKTIIIITHKLDELKKVADTGTVIRLGKHIADIDIKKTTHKELSKLMIGSELTEIKNEYQENKNEIVLKVENLNVNKKGYKGILGLKNLSFDIKAGEILSIAGVEGNGQSELINALSGLTKIKSGSINLRFDDSDHIYNYVSKFNKYIKALKQCVENVKANESTYSVAKTNYLNLKQLMKENDKKFVKQPNSIQLDELAFAIELKSKITEIINTYPNNDIDLFLDKFDNYSTIFIETYSKIKTFLQLTEHSSVFENYKMHSRIKKLSKRLSKTNSEDNSQWIELEKTSIANKYLLGMANIPEDRHLHGLFLDADLIDNSVSQVIGNTPYSHHSIIKHNEAKKLANKISKNFDVRSSNGTNSLARSLSGGNQQKFIVGRELTKYSKFVLIAQPTRGLDVGAINIIHEYILKAKANGKAILLISYEIDEIIALSDRVLVLNSGESTGVLPYKEINRESLGVLMARKAEPNE